MSRRVERTRHLKGTFGPRWPLEYLAEFSEAAANRVDAAIEGAIHMLKQPGMGKPGLVEGTRLLSVPRTGLSIVYRVEEDCVRVIRMLHGAQDWPARF